MCHLKIYNGKSHPHTKTVNTAQERRYPDCFVVFCGGFELFALFHKNTKNTTFCGLTKEASHFPIFCFGCHSNHNFYNIEKSF